MKTLACKDIDPSLNCDYVARGEDMNALMADSKQHVASAHPEKMAQMADMSEEDMMKMVMPHVKEETTM